MTKTMMTRSQKCLQAMMDRSRLNAMSTQYGMKVNIRDTCIRALKISKGWETTEEYTLEERKREQVNHDICQMPQRKENTRKRGDWK